MTNRKIIFCFASSLVLAASLPAQVTHGQPPKLPAPFATRSAGNGPRGEKPPAGFLPTVPEGFGVNIFATNFKRPRFLTVAPNKDIFLADTTGRGQILILRDPKNTGGAREREVFVDGMNRPFGIAFHEDYVYVGNMNELVRFKYDPKTSKRLGEKEHLMGLPSGGHDTRTVVVAPDGKHLFIAVGSDSNINTGEPPIRAAVTICDLDGKNARQYATGLRNPVGLAIEPVTGELWTSVNERDELGDDLPPDYFTSLKDGGFYGWPYGYIGDNVDSRVKQEHPELVRRAIIPDVLLGAHVAPLQFAFYTGKQFPEKYWGGAFVAEHGSWNRSTRSGYQVAFVAFKDGKPSADPLPFLTGLVPNPAGPDVYGRPVGVTVAPDGSLLVSDDGAGVVYRISVIEQKGYSKIRELNQDGLLTAERRMLYKNGNRGQNAHIPTMPPWRTSSERNPLSSFRGGLMLAGQTGKYLRALCHEHHIEMTVKESGKTQIAPGQTATYTCPRPDCVVHYNPSKGYFLVAGKGQIELDSTPRVKCSVDGRPMYLAETNPQKRSFRLWKCPQCGSTRTNEERVIGASS